MTAQGGMLIRKQFLRQKATEFAAGRLEFEAGVGAALTVRLLATLKSHRAAIPKAAAQPLKAIEANGILRPVQASLLGAEAIAKETNSLPRHVQKPC